MKLVYADSIEEVNDGDAIVLYAEQYKDDIWEKKFYNITQIVNGTEKR